MPKDKENQNRLYTTASRTRDRLRVMATLSGLSMSRLVRLGVDMLYHKYKEEYEGDSYSTLLRIAEEYPDAE